MIELIGMAAFVALALAVSALWESYPRLRPWMVGAAVLWMVSSVALGVYSCAAGPVADYDDIEFEYVPYRP